MKVNYIMYKITKLWNRFIFRIIYLCVKMLWDYTRLNGNVFADFNQIYDYGALILADKRNYKKFKTY